MNCIASLTLLESGNIEVEQHNVADTVYMAVLLNRLQTVQMLWDNPDFQAMLDKAIEADKGGVEF